MSDAVSLFVHVSDACRYMLRDQDFPVLVQVDPPDATIQPAVEGNGQGTITYETEDSEFNGFNKIVRIKGLQAGALHSLYIIAVSSDGNDFACHSCGILREPSIRAQRKRRGRGKQKSEKEPNGYGGGPPEIVYPPPGANLPTSFTAYGYVSPTTAIVTVWVADPTGGKTYPGMSVPPPPPYNWAFAFASLPLGLGGNPVACTLYAQANGSACNESITLRKT